MGKGGNRESVVIIQARVNGGCDQVVVNVVKSVWVLIVCHR